MTGVLYILMVQHVLSQPPIALLKEPMEWEKCNKQMIILQSREKGRRYFSCKPVGIDK